LATELETDLKATIELVEGDSGIFDVVVDGKLVFSKHKEGDRFPDAGEIQNRLA
jgi:selT/selW/selH-like putative selenoprotein